jgi:hypothetical protein
MGEVWLSAKGKADPFPSRHCLSVVQTCACHGRAPLSNLGQHFSPAWPPVLPTVVRPAALQVAAALRTLAELPPDHRDFYARRLVARIRDNAYLPPPE